MRAKILFILLILSCSPATWAEFSKLPYIIANSEQRVINADYYLNFETSSAGTAITTTILTNSSPNHNAFGEWFTSNTLMTVEGSLSQPLLTPIVNSGTTYFSAGTRCFAARNSEKTNFARISFAGGGYQNITIAGWIKPGSTTGSFQTIDYIELRDIAGGGKFAVLNINATFNARAHSDLGSSATTIPWSADTLYWFNLNVSNGVPSIVRVAIWNTSGTKVGSTSEITSNCNFIKELRFGRIDAHGGTQPDTTSTNFYDDIIINTSGVFPLGP